MKLDFSQTKIVLDYVASALNVCDGRIGFQVCDLREGDEDLVASQIANSANESLERPMFLFILPEDGFPMVVVKAAGDYNMKLTRTGVDASIGAGVFM